MPRNQEKISNHDLEILRSYVTIYHFLEFLRSTGHFSQEIEKKIINIFRKLNNCILKFGTH